MPRKVRRARRRYTKEVYRNWVVIEELDPDEGRMSYVIHRDGTVEVQISLERTTYVYRVPKELFEKAKTMKPREWIKLFYNSPREFQYGKFNGEVFY
ncbi:MAG: hypothetical protein ACK4SY_07595 [Pyrobaculum sp.]